jgi:hypothetical protein
MFGQRFRLKTAAIATAEGPEKRVAVQIPAGAQILVLDDIEPGAPPDASRLVNVEWEGNVVSMFVVDIHEKGERMPPHAKRKQVSDE